MTRDMILKAVNAIFLEAFDDETLVIEESTNASDISDWDSLMQITLIAAVEDEFKIKFDLNDALSMQDVGDMLTIIESKIKK